jgi:hypothetical protein
MFNSNKFIKNDERTFPWKAGPDLSFNQFSNPKKVKKIIHQKVKEDRLERKKYDVEHDTKLRKSKAKQKAHKRVKRNRLQRKKYDEK